MAYSLNNSNPKLKPDLDIDLGNNREETKKGRMTFFQNLTSILFVDSYNIFPWKKSIGKNK